MGEGDTLLDVALQTGDGLLQQTLLLGIEVTKDINGLLDTVGLRGLLAKGPMSRMCVTYAELNGDREEVNADLLGDLLSTGNTGEIYIARLDEALGTSGGLEHLLGEPVRRSILGLSQYLSPAFNLPETGVRHTQGCRTGAILGLDDLITTELDAVDQGVVLVVGDGDGRLDLAEEWDDGLARVAADDGNGELLGSRLAGNLGDEGLCPDNIERGNAKQALGVEDALGFQDLGGDGHGRVDGIGDDEDEGLGGDLGGDFDQALDDASVDVKQVVTRHAGLAWCCQSATTTAPWRRSHLRGIPAGMTMMSASLKAVLAPSLGGR